MVSMSHGRRADDAKLTTLGDTYRDAVGRWQDFYGYLMPTTFTTPLEEVEEALRNVVMFDISDMLYTVVSGENVLEFAHKLQIRRFEDTNKRSSRRRLYGRSKYTFFLEDGFVKEDGMIGFYDGSLVITTNVCLRKEMLATYRRIADEVGGVEIADCTDTISAISVQGRNLQNVLDNLFDLDLPRFAFTEAAIEGIENNALRGKVGGELKRLRENPLIFKLSYGVDGIEIVADKEDGPRLWNRLQQMGVRPAAQVAWDVLRLLKGYPLSDTDFGSSEKRTPHELGYGHLVENTVCDGYEEIDGRRQRRISFVMDGGNGPLPRKGQILADTAGNEIGHVTSGGVAPLPTFTDAPSIEKKRIGMGYVNEEYSHGTRVTVEIRGSKHPAEIRRPPLINDADLKKIPQR
jgi:aminomethyltransferase